MRKGNKAISLVLTTLSVISLASCDVTSNSEGKILTYTYNGESLNVSTNDIINKYLDESRGDHAKAIYDALYELVVRASFEEGGTLSAYKTAVESAAKDDIETAKDSADNAGTSWHDYLISQGYDEDNTTDSQRENEFYLAKLYEQMTTRVNKSFENEFRDWDKESALEASKEDAKKTELLKEYNALWGNSGYINQKIPYHVRHVLVKVDASDTNQYSRGHITSANAESLYKVVNEFVNGTPFKDVAKLSDDTGSADNGGEYIMDSDESFVNEFKLGLYTYDTLLTDQTSYASQDNYEDKTSVLNIPDSVKQELITLGASYIPYGAVQKIYDTRNVTTNDAGEKIYDGDEDYLPRNIYFNKYFQNHNVGFITNEALISDDKIIADYESSKTTTSNDSSVRKITDKISGSDIYTDIDDEGHYKTSNELYFKEGDSKAANFKTIKIAQYKENGEIEYVETEKPVLCDSEGNPILVVRNQTDSGGIHFMIIERSPFDVDGAASFEHELTSYVKAGLTETEAKNYQTTIEEYYANVPAKSSDTINQTTGMSDYSEDFPHVEATKNGTTVYVPKKTYVQSQYITTKSNVNDTVDTYNSRVSDITEKLDGMSTVQQFSKYYWLQGTTDNSAIKIALNTFDGEDTLQDLVNNYIDVQQESNRTSTRKSMQDSWYTYGVALNNQTQQRIYNLFPEILAVKFGDSTIYKQGEAGYNPDYTSITGETTNSSSESASN